MDKTREERREQFQQLFNSIVGTSVDNLKTGFPKHASKLTEFLILSILNEGEVSVGYRSGNEEAATITFDVFNTDKMLTLKLKRDNKFELELTMRDFEDEEHVFLHELTQVEEKVIPEGFKGYMSQVLRNEEEEVFDTKSLQKGSD